MKIYLIPGLGFDNRIFNKLDLTGIDKEYIDWIEPTRNENINDYSKRLSVRIGKNSDEIIIIGHSLGGIISQEIATLIKIDKIILISSIKSRNELPFHFRIIRPLRLYKLFTKKLATQTLKYWGRSHGYESAEDQELFKEMVNGHSDKYFQWALNELSIWNPPKIPPHTKIYQIHGDKDKTFPIKLIDKPHNVIKNAGHFMVYKQPKKINELLIEEIIK